jgi:hypothetical protein
MLLEAFIFETSMAFPIEVLLKANLALIIVRLSAARFASVNAP